MGALLNDCATLDVLAQLNHRFCHDEIEEMAALQREFRMFSAQHGLRYAFALLNIEPDRSERTRWYEFLEKLKKYKSDQASQNGHDRIVSALKEDLESASPRPVFFTTHRAGTDAAAAAVTVSVGTPIVFSDLEHVTISIPVTPAHPPRKRPHK